MQINVGCFYFIKDSFFDIIDDPELMKNKENGNKRPFLNTKYVSCNGTIYRKPIY